MTLRKSSSCVQNTASSFDPDNGDPKEGPAEDPLKSYKATGSAASVTVVVA